MSLRNFLLISVLLHIIILTALFFAVKNRKEIRKPPMVATLISPRPLVKTPPPKLPIKKFRRAASPPLAPLVPLVKKYGRMRPLPPPTAKELKHMPVHGAPKQVASNKGQGTSKGPTKNSKGAAAKSLRPATTGKSGPGAGTRTIGRRDLLAAAQEAANEVAARDKAKGSGSGREGAVPFADAMHDYRYYGYMERLKEKIEGIWVYPHEAIEKRLYGSLEIEFTILKDGSLGNIRVVRTSGYPILDEAALKALKDGQPYWPLPDEWDKKSFTIDGHFLYTFMGSEIR